MNGILAHQLPSNAAETSGGLPVGQYFGINEVPPEPDNTIPEKLGDGAVEIALGNINQELKCAILGTILIRGEVRTEDIVADLNSYGAFDIEPKTKSQIRAITEGFFPGIFLNDSGERWKLSPYGIDVAA